MNFSNISSLYSLIDKADVVSFDIFDTLICRMVCNPKDIFRLTEKITGFSSFAKERADMQDKASQHYNKLDNSPHADFEQIYNYCKANSTLKINWDIAMKTELELETELIKQNTEIYAVYLYAKEQGKRIIAISDMYLGEKELKPILDKCGYDGIFKIYTSADCKKAKFNNTLYGYVCDAEKIFPSKLLHIGDNYKDDYQNSIKNGIKAYHYFTDKQYLNYYNKDKLFSSIVCGTAQLLSKSDKDYMYSLGANIGGQLYSHLLPSVLGKINELKPDKVFFLSRDGYCLSEIFKKLFPDIKAQYMYTSRRGLMLCSIDNLTDMDLALLPPYTYGQTTAEVLDYLGIAIPEEEIKTVGFINSNSTIKTQEDISKIHTLFRANHKIIEKAAQQERRNLSKYLNSIDFTDGNYLLFDSGWNGSTQYLLEKSLSLLGVKAKTSFIYAGIADNSKSAIQLDSRKYSGIFFAPYKNTELFKTIEHNRAFVIPELFFSSNEPPMHRYSENGIELCSSSSLEERTAISNGIIDTTILAYPLLDKYGLIPTALDAIAPMMRLIEQPTSEEARNIGNIDSTDGFVHTKQRHNYLAKPDLKAYKLNELNEIYWIKGIYARKDVPYRIKRYIQAETEVAIKGSYKHKKLGYNRIHRIYRSILTEGLSSRMYLYAQVLRRIYKKYLNRKIYERYNAYNKQIIQAENEPEYKPLISVIVPIYNVPEKFLCECIDSVLAQTYSNYELIAVDDCSTDPAVRQALEKYSHNDKIRLIYRSTNGNISVCTNTGIAAARGEYIALLDCDDTLTDNAIYEVTKAINNNKNADLIYSDEDKLSENSQRVYSPFFKPDWSPDTLMQYMYTSHLSVYRKELIEQLGGFRKEFDGAQDYDMALRVSEKTDRIIHIPKVLYHWKEHSGSIASGIEEKSYALKAVERAKQEAIKRRGLSAKITYISDIKQYSTEPLPEEDYKVDIIILSKDNAELLKNCINGLRNKTQYKNISITVVDNGSTAENKSIYYDFCKANKVNYIYSPQTFNYSSLCNIGAENGDGDYLLFLNDDIAVGSDDLWLTKMLGYASQPHIGAVGIKLLYPDTHNIQHCGVINTAVGPLHPLIGYSDEIIHYYGINRLDHNRLAVTGACLMINREKFNCLGGFDTDFAINYNDIDLCFRLYEKGLYNLCINTCSLYHHESVTRGNESTSTLGLARLKTELQLLYQKHPNLRNTDPFYNINLTDNNVTMAVRSDFLDFAKRVNIRTKSGNIIYHIDRIDYTDNIIDLAGYAFLSAKRESNADNIYIMLSNKKDRYIFKTSPALRPDVTQAYSNYGKLNLSGFTAKIDTRALANGNYQIGLAVKKAMHFTAIVCSTEYKIDISGGSVKIQK